MVFCSMQNVLRIRSASKFGGGMWHFDLTESWPGMPQRVHRANFASPGLVDIPDSQQKESMSTPQSSAIALALHLWGRLVGSPSVKCVHAPLYF